MSSWDGAFAKLGHRPSCHRTHPGPLSLPPVVLMTVAGVGADRDPPANLEVTLWHFNVGPFTSCSPLQTADILDPPPKFNSATACFDENKCVSFPIWWQPRSVVSVITLWCDPPFFSDGVYPCRGCTVCTIYSDTVTAAKAALIPDICNFFYTGRIFKS